MLLRRKRKQEPLILITRPSQITKQTIAEILTGFFMPHASLMFSFYKRIDWLLRIFAKAPKRYKKSVKKKKTGNGELFVSFGKN
jgi:pantothenate kinase type III